MKSIGDRLGRQEEAKRGDLWAWIKSKMIDVSVAIDAGCERIHREENAESKVLFIFQERKRGQAWRITPALRVGGFELLLDYKGWRGVALAWTLGC